MPVVYDGVGGGNGDLFEGLKLWISHRVPQRGRWIDLVKGNGGSVVPLEKQADMLIADNIKRGGAAPPPGSYTWKWIEYSVRNRFLQPKEDYLITAAEPRAAGSTVPTKGTRTPFTNHDDLILTKFVLAQERLGQSTKGNEIFRELERRHRHHPWQSWRDRWVKHLSSRPRPNLPDEDSQPEVEVEVAGSHGPDEPEQASARVPRTPRAPHAQPPKISPSTPTSKGRGRNFFTEEDDRLLLDYIQEAQEYNKTAYGNQLRYLSGNKIYKEFAEEHPGHTWHSWRDRWVRHLSRMQDEEADIRVKVEPQPQPHPRVNGHAVKTHGPAAAERAAARSRHAEAPKTSTTAVPATIPSPTARRRKPMSDEERLERQELARRRARAARLLQRTWRGFAERRDQARFETLVVPLQSLVRGYLVRMREAEKLLQNSEAKDQPLQDDFDEEDAEHYEDAEENFEDRALGTEEGHDAESLRDQFYDDLQDFIEVSGAEVDRQPFVDGRSIDLWDLFKAATQQSCNPEDRNWKKVANELGFDWTKSAICLPELWNCYIRNLGEFEEAMKSYDNAEDEGDEEDEQQSMAIARDDNESLSQTSDAVTAPKEPSAAPSPFVCGSSPPVAAVKRSFQHVDVLSSDFTYPSDSSRKRRRLEQRAEIPPTPEHKLELNGSQTRRGEAHDKSSPLKARGVSAAELDVVKSAEVAEELLNGVMEDVEGEDELPELPRLPNKRYVEPETQDFGFAIDDDDEDDTSPSQQLRTESDIMSNPVLPNSSGQDAATVTRRQFLGPKPRSGGNQVTKPASSVPATALSNAREVFPGPNRSVNGKITKRSLPQQYQKPSASTPGRVSRPTPIQDGITRPGPNSAAPGQGPGIIAKPYAIGPASRAKHATTPTPSLPMLSSPTPLRPSSSRRAPASTAPPLPQDRRGGLKRAPSSDFDNDPAVIDAQFAHFQALGYEKAHIGRALEAATFQRGPMTVALQSLHEGRGLPRKEAGVWTDDDDAKLKVVRDYDRRGQKGKYSAGSEADERQKARAERYREQLIAKHGKWMEPRLRFMEMMDEGARP